MELHSMMGPVARRIPFAALTLVLFASVSCATRDAYAPPTDESAGKPVNTANWQSSNTPTRTGSLDAATAESSTTVSTPDVPPLVTGELPPADEPNYFEPSDLGSGGIVAGVDSCETSAKKSSPEISDAFIVPYCNCTIDAMRRNLGATGDLEKSRTTWAQLKACAAAARNGVPSPFQFPFPKSTRDLSNAWLACVARDENKDTALYCGCYTDAIFSDPVGPSISPADKRRCEIADRYWRSTKTHLTVRQFKALNPSSNAVVSN